jgi:hypothetical protein
MCIDGLILKVPEVIYNLLIYVTLPNLLKENKFLNEY